VETAPVNGSTRAIDVQRAEISQWMLDAETANGREHPWATNCNNSAYHTNESPVASDPTAPHCVWASGRHSLSLDFLVDEKGYTIPHCLQYKPKATITSLISESKVGDLPRAIIDAAIINYIGALNEHGLPPLRFLTGVPVKASEKSYDWLELALKDNPLSDAQALTLLKWLIAEYELRIARKAAPIQLTSGRVGHFLVQ